MIPPSPQTWNTFYQKLGHLCYAIAAADNKVSKAEVAEVKRLVSEEWIQLEQSKDEFGADASFQIEIVFEWLMENAPKKEVAFSAFSEFYKSHPHFFTEKLKKKVLSTANSIATVFHDKNKAEMELLSRLKKLLNS